MNLCEWEHTACSREVLPEDSMYRIGRYVSDAPLCLRHLDYLNTGITHEKYYTSNPDKSPKKTCPCPFCYKVEEKRESEIFLGKTALPSPVLPNNFPTTPEGYRLRTGKQFRVTAEQAARIEAGEIDRQAAYDEFRSEQPEAIAYDEVLERKREIEQVNANVLPTDPFSYRKKFGRRFRMTFDQRDRGLTREEAYAEFRQENSGVLPEVKEVIKYKGPLPKNREEYKELLNKRFRMTKEQSYRNLTSDQAFAEWLEEQKG